MTDAERTPAPLPESIDQDGLVLARWLDRDAPVLHAVVVANVEHLRPFMAWAAGEPRPLEAHRELIATWAREWAAGGDLVVGIRRGGVVVGSAGLHRRGGPDELEIGYWVDHRHLRQGVASAAARALTDLAFTVPGIERVLLAHDLANVASAGVPERLGFRRLADRDALSPSGSAGTGREGVWVVTRAGWSAVRGR